MRTVQSDNSTPFQRYIRATVLTFGVVLFVIITAESAGQANDSHYTEGRPAILIAAPREDRAEKQRTVVRAAAVEHASAQTDSSAKMERQAASAVPELAHMQTAHQKKTIRTKDVPTKPAPEHSSRATDPASKRPEKD